MRCYFAAPSADEMRASMESFVAEPKCTRVQYRANGKISTVGQLAVWINRAIAIRDGTRELILTMHGVRLEAFGREA
ncbi:hypothetical protein HBH56_143090 [Parastagonospora nodorum]|nr:hypothetical protein HBH56_143090 [Parastagonospora nodorum]KAH3927692.1 hypothetical protein HBH54_148280 [Parastagonospora nodorum]KAH3947827.1 hypothetical protein HBH53_108320 [Parastagonospora nodorum]KAH4020411.1 hypothetical protein HBI13_114510 [Parastagonospora nodorum]KAH4031477.1 hypothetical protein HBI09_125280 [Parastagonospora nodorum]